VQATIQARVSKLSPQSQDVLLLAAIIGREFDFPTLKKASDLGEDELIDVLEVAERAQIIEEIKPKFSGVAEGEMFAFAHALIPATLREGVSGLRRHRLHRRVAMALEELCPEDMPRLEVLAYHYEQAGEAAQARGYYLRAGERALAIFASQEAEQDYRAALNLSSSDAERAPSLVGLGETLFRQSRYAESLDTWAEAIRLYREAGNHDRVAWLYARSGRAAWYLGDTPRGLAVCLEGLDVVRKMTGPVDVVETPGMAALLHETARAYRFNDKNDEGLQLCQQALAMAQRLNLMDVQAESLATLGILPNHPAEARRQALEQAIEIAEKAGLLATAARAHLNLGGYFQETGEIDSSLQHCQRARELAHRMGMASWESNFAISYADIAIEAGEFSAAERVLAELPQLHSLLVEPGRAAAEAYVKFLNANLLIRKGEWDDAIQLITQCLAECGQLPDPKLPAVGRIYLAEALMEKGENAAAEPVLLEALKALSKAPETDQLTVLCTLANLEVKQGQMDKARQYLAEAYRMAGEKPVERVRALLAWSEANLAAAEQRWAEASEKYEVIAGLLKHMNLRWHAARIQAEWAEMLARSNEPGDLQRAREMMSDAATRFEQLGVPKYAALMRAQLRAQLREKVNG